MKHVSHCLAAAAVAAVLGTTGAHAVPINIDTFDQGAYRSAGPPFHFPGNPGIFTGRAFDPGPESRSFFAFDLAPLSLSGLTAVSATLTLFANNGDYLSLDSSENFGASNYIGDINALLNGTGGVAAFADLGGGDYGQTAVNGSNGSDMPGFSITLSLAAIADINAAAASTTDTRFVVGGALLTLSGQQGLFGFSASPLSARLTLEAIELAPIPLPAAFPLFAAALGVAGLLGYRRRSKPATA